MKSEKRERSRHNNNNINMVQKLYDTCKQVFANGKAGYVPPPHDIQRLTSLLGMYISMFYFSQSEFSLKKTYITCFFPYKIDVGIQALRFHVDNSIHSFN